MNDLEQLTKSEQRALLTATRALVREGMNLSGCGCCGSPYLEASTHISDLHIDANLVKTLEALIEPPPAPEET